MQKYNLPSLCDYCKTQWKYICKKAINAFWTKQLVCDIKTKNTLEFLSMQILRIGSTHLV